MNRIPIGIPPRARSEPEARANEVATDMPSHRHAAAISRFPDDQRRPRLLAKVIACRSFARFWADGTDENLRPASADSSAVADSIWQYDTGRTVNSMRSYR